MCSRHMAFPAGSLGRSWHGTLGAVLSHARWMLQAGGVLAQYQGGKHLGSLHLEARSVLHSTESPQWMLIDQMFLCKRQHQTGLERQ